MADAFEQLMAKLDYPMLLVTAAAGGKRAGCLVGFYTQTSIDPQRLLVGLSDKNFTTRVAAEADVLCVHLLLRENRELAELFGGETGDEVDKFARCDWHEGPEGGRYELFYQFNPQAPVWAPNCRWGQVTSPDLVHWEDARTALEAFALVVERRPFALGDRLPVAQQS